MVTEHGGMIRVNQSIDHAMNGPILNPPCALVLACVSWFACVLCAYELMIMCSATRALLFQTFCSTLLAALMGIDSTCQTLPVATFMG